MANNDTYPSFFVHPGELIEFPSNSNQHSPKNLDELAESRRLFGQYKNVVVWESQTEMTVNIHGEEVVLKPGIKYVIAGNGFHQASILRGDDSIEIKDVSHLTFDEALMLAEIDNASPLGSKIDIDKLRYNLEQTRNLWADNDQIANLLDRARKLHGIQNNANSIIEDDQKSDKAAELQEKWGTELGQLWQLGSHRVICGDCTDEATVNAVMNEGKVEMMFTDPPYGVDYEGGHFHSGNVNIKRPRKKLEGDLGGEIYRHFLPVVLPFVDGPCYVWFADRGGKPVYDAIIENDCEIHAMIVWNKINATYAAMNAQYKQRHEPCMYFKPKRSTLRWIGPSDECTVWDEKRDPQNIYHPTQKPVVLAARALKNHSANTVMDCFLGSGSTIMAAEQLSRKCFGIEIDPGYVAVTIDRWHTLTGEMPVLLESK